MNQTGEQKQSKGNLLIRNARVIDGTDAPVREGLSILIRDGLIQEIAEDLPANGVAQLDVNGDCVLPGLIESHMHLMWGPGVMLHHQGKPTAENWTQTWGRNYKQHLKAYLACGVTTIHDVAAFPFVVHEVRKHYAQGGVGPRFLTLGPMISPPKGYANALEACVTNEQEVEAELDKLVALKTDGVKTCVEKGWSKFGGKYQRHSDVVLQAIKKGAEKRNLPIYVHSTCEEDLTTALKLGVHALAHTLILRNERLSDDFIGLMKQTSTYQMSTLSTMDASLSEFDLDRLYEPLLDVVVPEDELRFARNPEKRALARAMLLGYLTPEPPAIDSPVVRFFSKQPRIATVLFGGIMKLLHSKRFQEEILRASKDAIRRIHRAGIPVVLGSDAACTPSALYDFHGFLTLRELELLGEAGLTPQEAIKAATLTPARMLGLADEIGTIEVGKRADLVIVRDNPLDTLRAMRSVQWTVKDGVAHTPEEWMNQQETGHSNERPSVLKEV
jgi:imidazolonepropionase-like amidohydrolase